MSSTATIGHCWVVRWVRGEGYPFTTGVFQVLPWRWHEETVVDYLYGLYYNSPLRGDFGSSPNQGQGELP